MGAARTLAPSGTLDRSERQTDEDKTSTLRVCLLRVLPPNTLYRFLQRGGQVNIAPDLENSAHQNYFQVSATHFPFSALIRYIAGNLLVPDQGGQALIERFPEPAKTFNSF